MIKFLDGYDVTHIETGIQCLVIASWVNVEGKRVYLLDNFDCPVIGDSLTVCPPVSKMSFNELMDSIR